jgi:hypothetical protein
MPLLLFLLLPLMVKYAVLCLSPRTQLLLLLLVVLNGQSVDEMLVEDRVLDRSRLRRAATDTL